MKLSTVPEMIEMGRRVATDTDMEKMSNEELAVVSPFLWYVRQEVSVQVAEVLRAELIRRKREYDARGEVAKTPFALSKFTDPWVRQLILINTYSFATNYGCTGGCNWCGFDSYRVGPKKIETIPLEQKLHFTREFCGTAGILYKDPEDVRAILRDTMYYGASDPFDDPDIVPLMTAIYNEVGAVPMMSTVIPPSGEKNFEELANWRKKHKALRDLRKSLSGGGEGVPDLENFIKAMQQWGIRGFSDCPNFYQKVVHAEGLRGMIEFIEAILSFIKVTADEDTVKIKEIFMKYFNHLQHMFTEKGIAREKIQHLKLDSPARCMDPDVILSDFNLRSFSYYILHPEDLMEVRNSLNKIPEWGQFEPIWPGEMLSSIRYINDCLSLLGLGSLEKDYDTMGESLIAMLDVECSKLEADRDSGKWGPDINRTRVSCLPHRKKAVERLGLDVSPLFNLEFRSKEEPPQGYTFFKLSDVEKESKSRYAGICCRNGIEITPFGVFNAVAGRLTKDYPQGRILVPFSGFIEDNPRFCPGTCLSEGLKHVIVLDHHIEKGLNNSVIEESVPSTIFIVDGLGQLRKITFDRDTYVAVDDETVLRNVSSLEDLRSYLCAEKRSVKT